DLAALYLLTGRLVEAMANLGRAGRLLDGVPLRDVNYASALGSYGTAVHTAELYEAAREAYERLADIWAANVRPTFTNGDELASQELLNFGGRPEERLIIRYELASLAAEADGTQEARDLFDTVREQARQLWQLRLERVAMLRQAQQRAELEREQARTELALIRDPLTGLGNRRHFDQLMASIDAGTVPPPTVLLLVDV